MNLSRGPYLGTRRLYWVHAVTWLLDPHFVQSRMKAHPPYDVRAPQGAEVLFMAPSAQSGYLFWVCVRA